MKYIQINGKPWCTQPIFMDYYHDLVHEAKQRGERMVNVVCAPGDARIDECVQALKQVFQSATIEIIDGGCPTLGDDYETT